MNEVYYNVEQIAQILNIHPKTVQRYIREGKLRAVKLGKSWRVTGHDLSMFVENADTGTGNNHAVAAARVRTKASSVIDIVVGSKDEAMSIIRSLTAAMNVKPPQFGKTSLHAQFLEQDYAVRVTLWGNIEFMSAILNAIDLYTKQNSQEE